MNQPLRPLVRACGVGGSSTRADASSPRASLFDILISFPVLLRKTDQQRARYNAAGGLRRSSSALCWIARICASHALTDTVSSIGGSAVSRREKRRSMIKGVPSSCSKNSNSTTFGANQPLVL